MYMIINKHGVLLHKNGITLKDQVLNAAKARAEALHKQTGDHYTVVKIETVWSTQTLDQAINNN